MVAFWRQALPTRPARSTLSTLLEVQRRDRGFPRPPQLFALLRFLARHQRPPLARLLGLSLLRVALGLVERGDSGNFGGASGCERGGGGCARGAPRCLQRRGVVPPLHAVEGHGIHVVFLVELIHSPNVA
jgi:hypothetical protein